MAKVETKVLSRLSQRVHENLYKCDPNQYPQGVDPIKFLNGDDDTGTWCSRRIELSERDSERERE